MDDIKEEANKLRNEETILKISQGMLPSDVSNYSAPVVNQSNEVMESVGPVTSSVSAGMISSTVEPNVPRNNAQLTDYLEITNNQPE